MKDCCLISRRIGLFVALGIMTLISLPLSVLSQETPHVPDHIPPKRSSQIGDGFGLNADMPRDPYLPWNRWWWTRMFDAGFKWIRIGQYENSSDYTGWDWIEQKRGVYSIPAGLDDYVDSLVDNGIEIQVQLMYGNPMYTSPSGKLPDSIAPEPGSFHNSDRSLYSIFWPPTTPAQIAAFAKYVEFVVAHFRGKIHYYALWNEQDINYWNPVASAEDYGRLLKAFARAVHQTDPDAKVIYGGVADPVRDFSKRALDSCGCASEIDVFSYHTYPGYGQNLNPEAMDYGAYLAESPEKLREMVRNYPGIRKDIVFWDDEFNSIPSWEGSDESVQAKYVTRGFVYNLAAGVKTFVWLLAGGTDGNEYDDFGLIHGLTNTNIDFTPRPVYYALENTNAIFSDTKFDPSVEITGPDLPALRRRAGFPFMAYGFRSSKGKAVVAYWFAAHSYPGANSFPPLYGSLTIKNAGIQHPVLVDLLTGEIKPIEWKKGTTDSFESLPVRDSIMAITDASYFDWPVLPEAPSDLNVSSAGSAVRLTWQVRGGNPSNIIVERRTGQNGKWEQLAKLGARETSYTDSTLTSRQDVSYRVRALNSAGESAYSNVAKP